MTFQVTEHANGGHVVREIKVGIRVFPGAAVDPRSDADRAFTLEELGPVVAAMRRQVAFVYHEFTAPLLRRRRHRVTYRFTMRIEPTEDPKPVAYSEPTGQGYRAVSHASSRPHAAAFREAALGGTPNIAIAYRTITRPPCAPCLTMAGEFQTIQQSSQRPGTLEPVSNTIVVCGPALIPERNQTFAHEVGHLLGMADRIGNGREIMCAPHVTHPTRSLTPRDQNRLHDSANFQRQGRMGGPIEDLGQLTDPDQRR